MARQAPDVEDGDDTPLDLWRHLLLSQLEVSIKSELDVLEKVGWVENAEVEDINDTMPFLSLYPGKLMTERWKLEREVQYGAWADSEKLFLDNRDDWKAPSIIVDHPAFNRLWTLMNDYCEFDNERLA